MTILRKRILELRRKGKTYNEITKILNCAKSTVSYNCSSGETKKNKKRSARHSTKQGALYKKLQGFCYNYGKKDSKRKHYPLLNMGEFPYLSNAASYASFTPSGLTKCKGLLPGRKKIIV